MGNTASQNPAIKVESVASSNAFDDQFLPSCLESLQRMNDKVEEGLATNEIWNGNLIRNIISNAETYVKSQRILVLLLGSKKSGKTTMLNTLLGQDLVPMSFNSSSATTAVIITVGYHTLEKVSVKQCDPSTFLPLEEENQQNNVSDSQTLFDIKNVGTAINKLIETPASNSTLPSVQAAYNHSVKVFEILINSPVFQQYPSDIRENIRFVDTPGIYQSSEPIPFISCIKSLSQDSSPLIKCYVWVTTLNKDSLSHEKKLFENTCLHLHLKEKHNKNLFSSAQSDLQKSDFLQSICNVIKLSSSFSESHSNNILESIDNGLSKRTVSDYVHSDETSKIISINDIQVNQESKLQKENQIENGDEHINGGDDNEDDDDDFQVIDYEQVQQDLEELRIRIETVSNLCLQKFQRHMIVVVNTQDDRSFMIMPNQNQVMTSNLIKPLPEEKFVKHLQSILEKKAIRVWPLPYLLTRRLESAGYMTSSNGSSNEETNIFSKFNQDYKDVFKSFKEETIFLGRNQNQREWLIQQTGFKSLELQIQFSIKELMDYKIMKRRRRIQEVIDKSCSLSSNIILNQQKKTELEQFIQSALPIIQTNHQILIQNHLHNLHQTSQQSRTAIIQAVNEVYTKHKSYSLFDKAEAQLNSLILEYLRNSVQSLASAMEKGDKMIEANKDTILNELKLIDPSLQEGIKSIITDFKKRSMQRANHAITTNMCLSLQQNFSVLAKVLSTSSIITGLSVLLHRIAGRSIASTGPTGLAVAVGMTAVSTVWYVSEREKKLKQGQVQILQYLDELEAGQNKIHLQLISSYTAVYNEVIDVIRDYLNGIVSTTFDQLLSQQNILREKQKNLEESDGLQHHLRKKAFSSGTISSSSGEEGSDDSEDQSEPLSHEEELQRNHDIELNPPNSQKVLEPELKENHSNEKSSQLVEEKEEEEEQGDVFYSFHEQSHLE